MDCQKINQYVLNRVYLLEAKSELKEKKLSLWQTKYILIASVIIETIK